MKFWKWVAIICVIAYVSMINIVLRTGEMEGVDLQSMSILYIIIGISAVYVAYRVEKSSMISKEVLVPLAERFEKVERICNACVIKGGKMKCEYYRNPQAIITKCDNSTNPDGKE